VAAERERERCWAAHDAAMRGISPQ
jgi:hypothetical protein